jgi:hypothetical protein
VSANLLRRSVARQTPGEICAACKRILAGYPPEHNQVPKIKKEIEELERVIAQEGQQQTPPDNAAAGL